MPVGRLAGRVGEQAGRQVDSHASRDTNMHGDRQVVRQASRWAGR